MRMFAAAALCTLAAAAPAPAQTRDAGRRQYESLCSRCHGGDAQGGQLGPGIVARLASRTNQELATLIRARFAYSAVGKRESFGVLKALLS